MLYKIEEFSVIEHSVNITLSDIKEIAVTIFRNYHDFDAFIVLTGMDSMCNIATYLSFMFENLSKLVPSSLTQIICTGGLFPITFMRNDIISNLISAFSTIVAAESTPMLN